MGFLLSLFRCRLSCLLPICIAYCADLEMGCLLHAGCAGPGGAQWRFIPQIHFQCGLPWSCDLRSGCDQC